jgi:hypothetical protein
MGGLSFRAVQGLSVDDEDLVRQPALAEIQGDNAKCGFSEASLRQEAELRTLLASLRHADRELRTARSAIAASAPAQPDRLRRSRSLDREEMQNQLVSCKLRAAQLEEERSAGRPVRTPACREAAELRVFARRECAATSICTHGASSRERGSSARTRLRRCPGRRAARGCRASCSPVGCIAISSRPARSDDQ